MSNPKSSTANLARILPDDMSGHYDLHDWTEQFRQAVRQACLSADPDVLEDVQTTWLTGFTPTTPEADAEHLIRVLSPGEVFDAFEGAREYVATIRLPDLPSVIGSAHTWSQQLRDHLEWWLVAHNDTAQLNQLRLVAANLDVVFPLRRLEPDAADIGLVLADQVQPRTLLRALHALRPRQRRHSRKIRRLTRAHATELQTLYAAVRAADADRRPSARAALAERLAAHRRRHVTLAALAQATGLTATRIHQLSRAHRPSTSHPATPGDQNQSPHADTHTD